MPCMSTTNTFLSIFDGHSVICFQRGPIVWAEQECRLICLTLQIWVICSPRVGNPPTRLPTAGHDLWDQFCIYFLWCSFYLVARMAVRLHIITIQFDRISFTHLLVLFSILIDERYQIMCSVRFVGYRLVVCGDHTHDLLILGRFLNGIDMENNLMLDALFNERQSVIAFLF